jgi:hypothetical protein
MKEINEQWIKDEAEKVYPEKWKAVTAAEYHDENFAVRQVWISGANSILPEYNSLKADNERLRERVKELEELASENAKIAVASASYFYGLLSEGEEDERSVANPPNSSTGPDKQSPQ